MIRETWRNLSPLLHRRDRRSAVFVVAGSLFAGLLEALLLVLVVTTALVVAEGNDRIVLSLPVLHVVEIDRGVALLAAGVSGLVMLAVHLQIARLTARLSAAVLHSTRERALEAFVRASWERQAQDREGALQELVSTLAVQTSGMMVTISNLVASLIGLLVLLAAAFVVDPLVTFVVLAFGSLIFLGLRPVSRLTQQSSANFVDYNSRFAEEMSQWGAMAMELRVFGVEQLEVARLSEQNTRAAEALGRLRFMVRAASELYRDLAILFLVGAVAALYLLGEVQLASVGSVVLLIVRSLSYAQMLNAAMQGVHELRPNLDALVQRLESLESAQGESGTKVVETIGPIVLRDAGYEYEPGRPGIHGITLQISPGEVIGIIGPSGAGKSTLVQVLLRLRLPTTGSVTIAGLPYGEIDSECWHRLAAVVPQEPKLFQGTIADNIAFLRQGVTRDDVECAATAAHVLSDIRRLPDGFDTELGPRGGGLSAGQKQRIAIARALLGQPQLLVLDEPTSALDVRSEQLLQTTIERLKGRVTMVIIAHRLTTLACCDRVMAMEDGRVKLLGSLEEALRITSFDEDAALTPSSGASDA